MFWYLLIVEEKPTDWTFWAMLLLQNLNYILMNTGVYEDLNALRLLIYKRCILANSNSKKRKLGKRNSDLPTANDDENDNNVDSSSSSHNPTQYGFAVNKYFARGCSILPRY